MKKYTQDEIDNLIIIEDNKKYIKNIDFSNCDLSRLQLANINFIDCDFINANLNFADLRQADLSNADLSSAYNITDKTLNHKLLLTQLGIFL